MPRKIDIRMDLPLFSDSAISANIGNADLGDFISDFDQDFDLAQEASQRRHKIHLIGNGAGKVGNTINRIDDGRR